MQSWLIPVERSYEDVLQMLLQDKRSDNTKRAYEKDIADFFMLMTNRETNTGLVNEFLAMRRPQAVAVVLQYKADLIKKGLKEATINRRLAALRSLVSFARRVGRCEWDLSDVEGEKVQTYRDVSGVDVTQVSSMLASPDQQKPKGKRDYAILRLLWENALRRGEIVKCNIADFDPESRTLAVLGKGRGTQKELIELSERATLAISRWVEARGDAKPLDPLFIALDNAHGGHRLTGEAIAYLVKQAAKAAGINKKMSPHRMRHSSITAALEATNGNVSKVQKLSRHAKIETLMIYEDRRENQQKEVTELLSALA